MSIPPPPGDRLSFTPSRDLLNPKFESYKLEVPSSPEAIIFFALPSAGFRTRPLPDHARLAFTEVQARVRHNHLSTGKAGELVYVDAELKVVAIELGQTGGPTYHSLVELPTPVASSSSTRVSEYPDAIALTPFRWAVSDGTGRIYIVSVDKSTPSWIGRIEETYELSSEAGDELLPFRLHAAHEVGAKGIFALLSIPIKVAPSALPSLSSSGGGLSASARHKIPSTTAFEYLSVSLGAPQVSAGEDVPMEDATGPKQLEVLWRLHSHDLPSYVSFDAEAERYIIGAPSSLTSNPEGPSTPSAPTRPSSTAPSEATPEPSGPPIPRPPPFSWTQDPDSLTVVFALPSDTPTSSIRITFSRQFLTLHIGSAASALAASSTPSTLPHVSHKKLWDSIDPHTSVWTFDREAEGRDSTFGLLSLHLEKANAGVKWTDVFALTAPSMVEDTGAAKITELTTEQEEQELEHVVETLDPSELAKISENMEQWTKGEVEGGAAGEVDGDGLGHGVPTSLIGEEIDVEVDGDSGRPLIVTWVESALTPEPRLIRPHPTIPYSLLSTPLPLSSASTDSPDCSITIKHDVDGLLFTPPSLASSTYTWTHTATFPALAFVLATKQDASFIHHLADRAVFAFDAPSSFSLASPAGGTRSGAGNLFVYCRPEDTKGTKGVQMVLRVGGPSSGALVGVAGVVGEDGKVAVVALCEKEIWLLRL